MPENIGCTFCKNKMLGLEEILYEDDIIWIARPHDMKQHKERIVIVSKAHTKDLPEGQHKYAYKKGLEIARAAYSKFSGIEKIAIMEDSKSRFPGHWHRVITDLDSSAPDYRQIVEETEYTEYSMR